MGKSIRIGLCFAMVSVLGLVACGSDDDENTSKDSAALSSCNTLCDKQEAGQCSLLDLQSCKEVCGAMVDSLDAACLDKHKVWWNCQNSQADACDETACQTEMDAAATCLAG
jgi:hypothetical protein